MTSLPAMGVRATRSMPDAAACQDCLERGHYCPGLVTSEGGAVHLCFACDEGVPCGNRSSAPLNIPEAAPIELVTERLDEQQAKASLKAARILGRKTRVLRMKKIPVEQISSVEAALATATPGEVARRFNCRLGAVNEVLRAMRRRADKPAADPPAKRKLDLKFDVNTADLPTGAAPEPEKICFDPSEQQVLQGAAAAARETYGRAYRPASGLSGAGGTQPASGRFPIRLEYTESGLSGAGGTQPASGRFPIRLEYTEADLDTIIRFSDAECLKTAFLKLPPETKALLVQLSLQDAFEATDNPRCGAQPEQEGPCPPQN